LVVEGVLTYDRKENDYCRTGYPIGSRCEGEHLWLNDLGYVQPGYGS